MKLNPTFSCTRDSNHTKYLWFQNTLSIFSYFTISHFPLFSQSNLLVLQYTVLNIGLPGGSKDKESTCHARDLGLVSGPGRFSGKKNSNPLNFLAWRILWTEESGRLQSMGCRESNMTEKLNRHNVWQINMLYGNEIC